MGIIDIKAKLADIKSKIEKVVIGLNKEEKKLVFEVSDQSTHTHYHSEIGLSDEDIIKLSDEEVGKFVRYRSYLNLKAAIKDKPDEMQKLLATYQPMALIMGATSVTASTIAVTPMPSGDFIEKLSPAIWKTISTDEVKVDEVIWAHVVEDEKEDGKGKDRKKK